MITLERLTALLFALGTLSPVAAQVQPLTQELAAFSIRADPSIADKVNRVLAQYGENATTDIRAGEDAADVLQRRCGSKVTPHIVSVTELTNGKQRVTHAPCVRIGGSRTVVVEPGLTLEGIAGRWGLRSNTVSQMRIRSGAGNPIRASIAPTAMLPGDEVVLPRTGLWTEIQLKREFPLGRSGLLMAIAEAVGCSNENADACVRGKGLLLLQQGQSAPELSPQPDESTEPPKIEPRPTIDWPSPEAQYEVSGTRYRSLEVPVAEAAAALAEATSVVAVTAYVETESQGSTESTVPSSRAAVIASDQWPYDARRVAAVLAADRDLVRFVRVGVADGGLRAASGDPLPTEIFARNERELDEGEADDDDDENLYVDDFYGAGVRRSDDAMLATDMLGTGKLDLCSKQPDFTAWSGDALLRASHGSAVSSIAAGWPLRTAAPGTPLKLPYIQFYRMLTGLCGPDSPFEIQDGDINKAVRYLFDQRASVVNISYKIPTRGENPSLREAVSGQLNNDTRMLVVAAGNDDADDLDDGKLCPACLGTPNDRDFLARRVLVVGAAERTLKASPGSNHGEKTVRFYAPGQALGIDILGRPIADPQSATSYSAPLVTFAVALLKAYEIENYWEITERLDAASWPLLMGDDSPSPTARVVDVTKVVAVYRDVVEANVVEDGVAVRRNYVGTIVGPIQDLGICRNKPFKRGAIHSIRLSPVNADGTRLARWEGRQEGGGFPQDSNKSCRSSGTIIIDDILENRVEVALDQVNQILLRWRAPPRHTPDVSL